MKKLFFGLLLLCSINLFAKDYTAVFNQPSNNEYQVTFNINNWDIINVNLDNNNFSKIVFSTSTNTDKKGWAELPFISAAVQLPADKDVDFEVTYSNYTDLKLENPLVPSRGVFYRNQDPSTIPYEIDPNSIVDDFYPSYLVKLDDPFIIRDVRGTSVRVFPFKYNAVTKTLRVYTTIQVTLKEKAGKATNPLLTENKTPVKEVIGMYESIFINFDKSKYNLPMAEFGEILVICTSRDESAIEPYIQWKKEKGFKVYKEVVTKGTNVKNLIKNKYQANNNILYVQLVGDWPDIKSDNSIDSSPTDPKMGCVVGTDNFPDISIGRFSCSNTTELTTQVNKTIKYEKDPITTLNWRETAIGVASSEGPGDDGETDTEHIQNIYNNKLSTFTYNNFKTNFGWWASASTLKAQLNEGASTLMYCGHGSATSFGTTGFSNSHIAQLTNGDMLPFIVSVACVNGAFHYNYDCFAEAWLKKQNGGAIVTWMSTINQPWYPPMRGQDYFCDILIGGYDYSQYSGQNGISTNEQRTTWGAITVNASNLMLSESQQTSDIETVHTWTTFGDVSLQLRTKKPDEIVNSNNNITPGSPYTTKITYNNQPVKDALVCISQNNKYYSAFTNENGNVTINHDFSSGNVLLVVTAFNTTTIYKEITVSGNSPYVIATNYSFDGDGNLYAGQTAKLTLTVKNQGNTATNGNTLVTLSCSDSRINITDNSEYYGQMQPNESLTINNGYTFKASSNISDGETFLINVTATNGSNTWNSDFNITVYDLSTDPITNLNYNISNNNNVNLTWNHPNSSNIDSYIIYFDGTQIGTTTNLNYTHTNVEFGTHTYCVVAVENDIESEPVCITITINAPVECNPVTNLVATVTNKLVKLTWDAPIDNGNYSYRIYKDGAFITVTQNTTFSQQNLDIGTHTFCVEATKTGCVADQVCVDATIEEEIIECNPITNLTYTINDNNVTLTWNAPIDNDTYNYKIYKNGVFITKISNTSFTQYNLGAGTYNYCIEATKEDCIADQVCVNVIIEEEIECNPITNLTSTVNDNNVTLNWNVPIDNGNYSYKIYKDGTFITTVSTNNFSQNNLEAGTYNYCVEATKEDCIADQVCINVTIEEEIIECNPITNLTSVVNDNNVTLNWDDPTDNSNYNYNIYKDGTFITTVSTNNFSQSNLEAGTYNYCVEATKEDCIADQVCINVTIEEEIIECNPITNLTSIVNDNNVTLNWDVPIDNNTYNYKVYQNNTLITTVSTTTFTHQNLEDGTYNYCVEAIKENCIADQVCTEVTIQTTGINDSKEISIYPNPSDNIVNIEGAKVQEVRIYNNLGQLINIEYSNTIDISYYVKGVYLFNVKCEDGNIYKLKVIKN